MAILGDISSERFIRQYWQKEPLLVRRALSAGACIDGDELAGLACEQAAESRIVRGSDDRSDWQCEQGPFAAADFHALAPRDWTLLVQAVDQWVPEVAELLEHFSFLPRWRLDDVMISYAPPGGGVGPHFDYYDVFLLQARGKRRWRIGQRCDEHSPLRVHPDMKLLQHFEERQVHDLDEGDLLYLPSGLAHWGTSTSEHCTTISFGFRSPSYAELLLETSGIVAEQLPTHLRYRDAAESIDGDRFRINPYAISGLQDVWNAFASDLNSAALLQAFGKLVTEPRYPGLICSDRGFGFQDLGHGLVQRGGLSVRHHPSSRFAYATEGERCVLFVDGDCHFVSCDFAVAVCRGEIRAEDLREDEEQDLLLRLLNQGSLELA